MPGDPARRPCAAGSPGHHARYRPLRPSSPSSPPPAPPAPPPPPPPSSRLPSLRHAGSPPRTPAARCGLPAPPSSGVPAAPARSASRARPRRPPGSTRRRLPDARWPLSGPRRPCARTPDRGGAPKRVSPGPTGCSRSGCLGPWTPAGKSRTRNAFDRQSACDGNAVPIRAFHSIREVWGECVLRGPQRRTARKMCQSCHVRAVSTYGTATQTDSRDTGKGQLG